MNWKFWQAADGDASTGNLIVRAGIGAIAAYFVIVLLLGWWWDYEPDLFDARTNAMEHAQEKNRELVTGYITTTTLITLAETLLDKRGGYLSNDLFPPGVWMDNVPNWEFGVLTQVRDAARSFRNEFSRSHSQSVEDEDLREAEGKFFFDKSSWALPHSESETRSGVRYLEAYL